MASPSPVPVPRPRSAPRQLKPPVPKPRAAQRIPYLKEVLEEEESKSQPSSSSLPPQPVAKVLEIPEILPPPRQNNISRPNREVTKSLLFDFDPLLIEKDHPYDDVALSEEEGTLGYGRIRTVQQEPIYDPVAEDEEPSGDEDEEPPPPPPRMDSIPREMWDRIPAATVGNSVVEVERLPEAAKRSTGINRAVRGLKSLIGEVRLNSPLLTVPLEALRRPQAERQVHEGRLTLGGREKQRVLARLSTKHFSWLPDGGKKWINWSLEHFVFVTVLSNQGSPAFELTNFDGISCSCLLWLTQTEEERDLWLRKLISALTEETAVHEYTSRLGWLYLKEGVGGAWRATWCNLHNRVLKYYVSGQEMQSVDLRKARCFEKGGDKDGFLSEQPMFVVQMDTLNLYLQGICPKVTEHWRLAIRNSIQKNGALLNEQRLTPSNVVVLVDLCANFVITNGVGTEGIYRKTGQTSKIAALLEALFHDPYEVILTRNEYTEHEVAAALKRFFVNLPEPVLSEDLMRQLAECRSSQAKGQLLRKTLSTVAHATVRKLLGHLHLLALGHSRNKMDAHNLATIWAVGLTHSVEADITTLSNIITHYPDIFEVEAAEMQKEAKIIQMLERLQAAPPQNSCFAGDLKIWLTLGNTNSTDTVQVTLTPHKSAGDVFTEANVDATWQLREVALGGSLWRPMHPSENVMEAVARWGFWSDEDRAHNKLVLGPCPFYEELRPLAMPPATTCGHFKVALPGAKGYKDRFMQLQQGTVTCSKMKGNVPQKIIEWAVTDYVWYNGFDPKRGPTGDRRWYLTLVPKSGIKAARSKEAPYFGITIAMEWRQDLLEWCASLTLSAHPLGLGRFYSQSQLKDSA